jgi:hypothetical protein
MQKGPHIHKRCASIQPTGKLAMNFFSQFCALEKSGQPDNLCRASKFSLVRICYSSAMGYKHSHLVHR